MDVRRSMRTLLHRATRRPDRGSRSQAGPGAAPLRAHVRGHPRDGRAPDRRGLVVDLRAACPAGRGRGRPRGRHLPARQPGTGLQHGHRRGRQERLRQRHRRRGRHAAARPGQCPQAHRRRGQPGRDALRTRLLLERGHLPRLGGRGRHGRRRVRAAGAHGQPPELLRRGLLPGRHPGVHHGHDGEHRLAAAVVPGRRFMDQPPACLRRGRGPASLRVASHEHQQRHVHTARLRRLRSVPAGRRQRDRHRGRDGGLCQRHHRLPHPRGPQLGQRTCHRLELDLGDQGGGRGRVSTRDDGPGLTGWSGGHLGTRLDSGRRDQRELPGAGPGARSRAATARTAPPSTWTRSPSRSTTAPR